MDLCTGRRPPVPLELCATCMGVERACATTARDAGGKADEETVADKPGTAGKRAPPTTRPPMPTIVPLEEEDGSEGEDITPHGPG